jgi:molybdate transport repressor ModE-like protein
MPLPSGTSRTSSPNADRWGALEVRHVRAFAAVVERGSFAGAARELGYTQSAVSQQIFALERIVGAPVLLRHPGGRRPAEPTEIGRVVLAHAHPLLARVKAAQADVAALTLGEAGHVGVATFQSFGARVLPMILARFRSLRPGVDVAIQEMLAIELLLGAVESGDVDVAFATLPIDGPFGVRPLFADPYVLVTRANGSERGLRDLDGRRMLGIRGCRHEHFVEATLLAAGVTPAGMTRFGDNGMIQALAASGEGVAVVPERGGPSVRRHRERGLRRPRGCLDDEAGGACLRPGRSVMCAAARESAAPGSRPVPRAESASRDEPPACPDEDGARARGTSLSPASHLLSAVRAGSTPAYAPFTTRWRGADGASPSSPTGRLRPPSRRARRAGARVR